MDRAFERSRALIEAASTSTATPIRKEVFILYRSLR
jgi:hypothetical protein